MTEISSSIETRSGGSSETLAAGATDGVPEDLGEAEDIAEVVRTVEPIAKKDQGGGIDDEAAYRSSGAGGKSKKWAPGECRCAARAKAHRGTGFA